MKGTLWTLVQDFSYMYTQLGPVALSKICLLHDLVTSNIYDH